MVSKVSYKPAISDDETKIDTETTTDEETKNAITDENNDARDDTENLDKDINDKAGSPEDSDKENSKNKDYVSAYIKEQNVKKSKGVGMAEDLAVAGGGASAVGIATLGISKLVKSSGNDKKDEPKPEPKPEPEPEPNKKEEKGGFVEWYKNNLGVSIPLTIISLIIARMIYFELWQQIVMYKKNAGGIYLEFALEEKDDNSEAVNDNDRNIKPFFGLWKSFTKIGRFAEEDEYPKWTITYRGFDRLKVNFVAAATFAKYDWKYCFKL